LDQRVEAKWFGPCHLDDAVHRLPDRNSLDRHGDIVGGHGILDVSLDTTRVLLLSKGEGG
jgi:hypothetical protein